MPTFYTVYNSCRFHSVSNASDMSPPPEDIEGVYSATEKAVIRNHMSYICRKQHCADTLVLYLNSPTRNDGAMLLWDANLNGIVSGTHHHSHSRDLGKSVS